MSKREIDFEMVLGDVINDEIELRLILEGLQNFDEQEVQTSKNNKQSSLTSKLGEFDKSRTNIQELANRQQLNFKEELDIQGGKKYRNFKVYEPQKFRLLGHNQQGKPLFKFSDLFLTSDPKVSFIFNKYFDEIIHGSANKNVVLETGQLSKKYQKGYDFNKLVESWEKKQYEDFTNDKKNKMNEQQLEEVVVNRGDSKDNYFIYKVGQRRKYDYQDIYDQKYYKNGKQAQNKPNEYINYNLLNPRFVQNLHKATNRLRSQYTQIQQFESQDQKGEIQNTQGPQQNNTSEIKNKDGSYKNIVQDNQVYWGEIKDKDSKDSQNGFTNPVKTALVQEQLRDIVADAKKDDNTKSFANEEAKNNHCTFVDNIIKQYSIVNHELLNNSYKGKQTLNQYNRIEYHLENPNFFLTKLHYALQKKSEQFTNFVQKGSGKNMSQIGLNRNMSVPSALGDRSIVSGSNQKTLKASQMDEQGQLNEDDDHESIESKLLRQMSLQSKKKPINHSQIATKLHYIKFSNQLDHFENYHRFEFRYDVAFESKKKIQFVRNTKPLKCKGTDFNINIEKKDSYTKFSRTESLSLASGDIKQFIMVEYIEQTPLLMSDVGMCQRIILQVNNKEMLHKINKDIIQTNQIQVYEDMRDNPDNNKPGQASTVQQKMQLWRKNIKSYFGENGKVYLWQPNRESKLIGNPDGLGIALMESNLAAMPIVKKTPNKRDFLLVRQRDRWVIRKIDSLYVSGQVEPKQVVSSPGDRPYQTFLQKYQVAFLTKIALANNYKISIDSVKGYFPNTPQTSAESRIRKILKQKMNTQTKDNKIYQLKLAENEQISFKLDPQQYCLFQRMQKSLCQLQCAGIQHMRSMEKMKSILRKYFWKTNDKDLRHFATARMIRDQLQLTSWYLTQSFSKFMDKHARIQMVGHADPTNGHGGYSFIKKPQKERTDKDEAQQRQEKNKLSGTQFDLRKLKSKHSVAILQQRGYTREQLIKLGRWSLVSMLKGQKDTEYARKQRESKELKEQNERKQRSKALNTLLRNLRNEDEGLIESYQYGYNPYLDLEYYCERERQNWETIKQKYEKSLRRGENGQDGENGEDGDDDGDDDD